MKFEDRVYKVVTLGEGRVGKTSIITRYFNNSFSDQTQETTDGYCKEKKIKAKRGMVDLAIWVMSAIHIVGHCWTREIP